MSPMPTIYDVAAHAGVSHTTVSRALFGRAGYISESTKQRVILSAAELGYVPNSAAQALAGRTGARTEPHGPLHAVIADLSSPTARLSLDGFERAATTRSVGLRVIAPVRGFQQAMDWVPALFADGVSGVCVIADFGTPFDIDPPPSLRGAVVVIAASPVADVPTIHIDARSGWGAAQEHLTSLGHRSIALVGTWAPQYSEDSVGSTPLITSIDGPPTPDFGYFVGSHPEMLASSTAVIASSDHVAMGVLHGLRERGIDVPAEMSVVGMGDVPEARFMIPALTTVRYDFRLAGILAFERLIRGRSSLDGAGPATLDAVLSARATTAPVAAARLNNSD